MAPIKSTIISPGRAGMVQPALNTIRTPGEGSVSAGAPEPEEQTYYFTPVLLALMVAD